MSGCAALTRPFYLHVTLNVVHLGSLFMLAAPVDRLIVVLPCVSILRSSIMRAAIIPVVVTHMHAFIRLLAPLGTARRMCTRYTLHLTRR